LIPTPDGDELVAQLPADLDGTLVLAPADPRSVPLRFGSQGSEIYIPATRRPAATSVVARGHDLRQIERLRRQSLVERVAHATDTSELALAAIEELFEDEAGATEALADYAETCRDGHRLDRLGLAVLPTATIFSRLPIGASAEARLRSTAPILWAALAPRTATRWRLVRWPHPDSFGRGRWAFDDIVAFGQRQFAACDDGFNGLTTIRYVVGAGDSGRSRLRQTIQRLDRLTDPRFVDLVVTTYSAITVDAVMPEATRLLLDAHHLRPTSTTCAVLVGTALAFAAAED